MEKALTLSIYCGRCHFLIMQQAGLTQKSLPDLLKIVADSLTGWLLECPECKVETCYQVSIDEVPLEDCPGGGPFREDTLTVLPSQSGEEWVPPDVSHWRNPPRTGGPYYLPLSAPVDHAKVRGMVEAMRNKTWSWHIPLIRTGDQLLSGSHRYYSAKEAEIDIPTLTLDALLQEAGFSLKEVWEKHAQPFGGWLNNMRAALGSLPFKVRNHFGKHYGIDLGAWISWFLTYHPALDQCIQ